MVVVQTQALKRFVNLVAVLLALCACGSAHPSPTPKSPPKVQPRSTPGESAIGLAATIERTSEDTPRTTSSGATFTLPAGWSLTTEGPLQVLEPQEPDSHFALIDVQADDGDAAVAAAWASFRPDMKWPVELTTPKPGREGWEEVRFYTYEVPPNQRAVIYAQARRDDKTWTVFLAHASAATAQRRGAQVALIVDTLRPKGFVKESFTGKPAHSLDAERIDVLREFVETARRQLDLPGVALSLIDQGKVVFEGGFGIRELGKTAPVTADSLFLIASNTKSLTTLMLAKLVDEGKFTWETPVSAVFPDFKLGDAETTSRVQIQHLVCACTGLPRQDAEWIFESKKVTPKSGITLLGTMQPTTKFGETFQYSNSLAAAAGFIGGYALYPERELGAAYDEAMRTRVFDPLGMKSTTFDFARATRGNYARPHGYDVEGTVRVANMGLNSAVIPMRPTGGAWSSARDLAKYVQMELARGKSVSGQQLFSETNVLARRTPKIASGESAMYGMGLEVLTTWGVPVVHHGGGMFGYQTDLMFLPDYGVGAVILTNADTGFMLMRPFMRRLLEVLFDGRPEAAEDLAARATSYKQRLAKERTRLVVPADPAVVTKLARRYFSQELGEVRVKQHGAQAVLDFGEWTSSVGSRLNDDDTASLVTIDPTISGWSEFIVGEREGKRVLVFHDAQHEYVFVKAE
jgi:CubicO group peptidase (beta-lactamase class C family)